MFIRGTYYLSKAGVEADEVRELIQRRRLQILIHSCIYYKLATSLVSDSQWQQWANELVELQKQYPSICKRVDYHEAFEGFDGTTGFHLPFGEDEILAKALQLLSYNERKGKDGGIEVVSNRVVRLRF